MSVTEKDVEAKARGLALGAIDPARLAHVVIDLQNGFMEPGAPVEVRAARDIVPNVNRICAAVRAAGGLNIFIRFTLPDSVLADWPMFFARLPEEHRRPHQQAFAPDAHYARLWPQLDVRADDLIVEKHRFGAFIPGTCGLHDILQARNITTLAVTGTVSNVCCESTIRDAMQLNYRTIFIDDANAAMTPEDHDATRANLQAIFAEVVDTRDFIASL